MEKRSKVLCFLNSYSSGISGGDKVFIESAKRMKDIDMTIVTSSLGVELCEKEGVSAKFIETSREKKFSKIVFTYISRTISALLKMPSLGDFDFVLGTSDFLPDTLPSIFYRRSNKGTLWVQHVFHLIPKNRILSYLSQRISFELMKDKCDRIIVDSLLLKEQLVDMGFSDEVISINYPGIDFDFLSSVRPGGKKYDCSFIAQLRVPKGVYDLIHIWEIVASQIPDAKLAIIGSGNDAVEQSLKDLILEKGLDKSIDVLGFLSNNEAFSLIANSDVFVFPSHEEGFGIAPMEAQALGVPVVAWDLPIFREVFKKGMIRISMGQRKTFGDKVVTLLKNNEQREKLSMDALENSKDYSWENTYSREVEIFRSLDAQN